MSASSDLNNPCQECLIAGGDLRPLNLAPHVDGNFIVHPRVGPSPVDGWFVVAPSRHVEQIDSLSADELLELGPLLARVAASLRAETPCEKIYVAIFAEVLHHLHVHVIARAPDVDANIRGPAVFSSGRPVVLEDATKLGHKVLGRLKKSATPSY